MAKVYLDANIIIDVLDERTKIPLEKLEKHEEYISPLSVHIFLYVERKTIPYLPISKFLENCILVDLTEDIIQKSLIGPTTDFVDNIQLHSAAHADCDIFLTSDEKILDMKFFGKTQILSSVNLK